MDAELKKSTYHNKKVNLSVPCQYNKTQFTKVMATFFLK